MVLDGKPEEDETAWRGGEAGFEGGGWKTSGMRERGKTRSNESTEIGGSGLWAAPPGKRRACQLRYCGLMSHLSISSSVLAKICVT